MSAATALVIVLAVLAGGLAALFHLGLRRCRAAARADWGRGWLNCLDGLNRIFCRRFHRLRPVRLPLPKHGPALVVANHVSGLDPLLMIASAHRPLRFIIAREQYQRFGLNGLLRSVGCIPVDRAASPHRALAAARQALERGEVVALFPQGRIHLDREGPARLKPGVVHLAKLSGAPVFPLRIDGVRGEGRTVSAVFRRSRARVTVFAPLHYDTREPERLLATLGPLLAGHAHPSAPAAVEKPHGHPIKPRS
jgi:1-acyl-sn-glycerol-3-phosphate acyltransferase